MRAAAWASADMALCKTLAVMGARWRGAHPALVAYAAPKRALYEHVDVQCSTWRFATYEQALFSRFRCFRRPTPSARPYDTFATHTRSLPYHTAPHPHPSSITLFTFGSVAQRSRLWRHRSSPHGSLVPRTTRVVLSNAMQPASPAMPGFASSPALDLHARSAGATCLRTGVVSMRSKRSSKKAGRPRPNSGRSRDGDPARIQVNSTTLSLREQLKLVQGRNEAQAPRHRVERTRYRKRKPDADMYQSMGGPRGPDAEIPDGKYELSEQPVLYIDGYNIIGAWPRLRKQRDRGDLENARRLLVDDVTEFSHMRGWTCVVVFDACGNGRYSASMRARTL